VGWVGVVRAGWLHIHILISPFSCYWAFVVAYRHKFVAGLGVLWRSLGGLWAVFVALAGLEWYFRDTVLS
jgi:hypothetical protein